MPRRGQCRCGLILTFHRTAHGYKMRCPSCGAVVRLQVGRKRRRAPTPPALLPSAPDDIDVELLHPSEAPARSRRWVPALVVGAVALLGVVSGAVWWFLH